MTQTFWEGRRASYVPVTGKQKGISNIKETMLKICKRYDEHKRVHTFHIEHTFLSTLLTTSLATTSFVSSFRSTCSFLLQCENIALNYLLS